MPEPRLVTRMGEAGSVVSRAPGKSGLVGRFEETGTVGGHLGGGGGFERPARFLRPKAEAYPVKVTHYTTMKEIVQDAYVTSGQTPGYLNHISGYTGFQPRCPTAQVGSADWAEVSQIFVAPPEPEAPAPEAAE